MFGEHKEKEYFYYPFCPHNKQVKSNSLNIRSSYQCIYLVLWNETISTLVEEREWKRHYNAGCRRVLATQKGIFPFGSFNSVMADNKYFALIALK